MTHKESNTATTPKFILGEWVLVDKKRSGQIIECYGDSCVVDENGMWNKYDKERLTKDIRYLTPSEYYEQRKRCLRLFFIHCWQQLILIR